MLDYKLAKALKDAGFWSEKGLPVYKRDNKTVEEYVPDPTLSELIAACGDSFGELWRYEDGWGARLEWNHRKEAGESHGSTPEEAVAKLWLALNKHE